LVCEKDLSRIATVLFRAGSLFFGAFEQTPTIVHLKPKPRANKARNRSSFHFARCKNHWPKFFASGRSTLSAAMYWVRQTKKLKQNLELLSSDP
jgi:hypothetical protein